MPFRVTKTSMFQRFFNRLGTREYLPEGTATPKGSVLFDIEHIIPVINLAENPLTTPKGIQATQDVSGADGTFVALTTVPNGKQWTVTYMFAGNSNGNTFAAAKNNTTGSIVYLSQDRIATGAGDQIRDGMKIVLDSAWSLGTYISTHNASDIARQLGFMYSEEDNS